MVFRVSIALVALLVLIAGMAPGPFNALMQSALTQVVRATGWRSLLVVCLALLFMLTTWFAVGERREMLDDTSAVVMTASTAVKSSPDKSSTDLFVLHEGTVVTITDRLDGWCEVVIADGKKGWVEGRKIEII